MSAKTDLSRIIKAYVQKAQNPLIDFENFILFLEKYIEKHEMDLKDLFSLRKELRNEVESMLFEFQDEGICSVQSLQNRIQTFTYTVYYFDTIEKEFQKIISRTETPFPTEDSLGFNLNPDSYMSVDIKIDFVKYLEKKSSESPPILLRLTFPDITKTIFVTTALLERTLIESVLQKVRSHLRSQKNAIYLQHKLLPVFRQKERQLKDQFINIVTKPDLILQEYINPSDFVFQFWTQLSSLLLKEYLPKKDKLEDEIDLCISAYIIGFYAVYFKGKVQKEKDAEAALKNLASSIEKPPYAFSFHEIYNMKDPKGNPYVKKISQQQLTDFFDLRTKPKDDVSLPELLKVRTVEKKEYFICRESVVKILIGRVFNLSKEIKNNLISSWSASLMNDTKLPEMREDEQFVQQIENILKNQDPLFHALLNFNLLFLLREQVRSSQMELDFLNGLFDLRAKSIVPLSLVFQLNRKEILSEAKLRLPFWKVIPFLSSIISFFSGLFQGSSKSKAPNSKESKNSGKTANSGTSQTNLVIGAASDADSGDERGTEGQSDETRRAQKARFKETIGSLKEKYIGAGGDIKKEMSQLISLWNPLLDPQAKANLVEDVNSLVRDFLRKMKFLSRLQAPDEARLEKLSDELSRHELLSKIRNKESLKNYIALYMLDILGKS